MTREVTDVSMPGRDAPIRVLIDHYHDSGWREARQELHGGPLQVTICRETLKWSVLNRYHVAIVDASAPATVSANELKATERFVSEGGGLVIAGSAPAYEFAAETPVEEMPANRVARRLGFRFTSASECAGEALYDRDFRLGYRGEDVEVSAGVLEGFGPNPPDASTWAPIEAPRARAS